MNNQNSDKNGHKRYFDCEQYTYEEIEEVSSYLKQRVSIEPKIGIICGTGLGAIAGTLTDSVTFEYKDIPKFPVSTVKGHDGKLRFGYMSDVPVICMQGRFHFFEGYPLWKCVMPVRLMKLLGVEILILSNAAGGLNSAYNVGDIMLIKDHINFVGFGGHNPLRGPNEEKFGPRFVNVNKSYNPEFIKEAKIITKDLGLKGIQEGVYACIGGPTFETVAELRAMRILGVDAVGMSTVHEVITARHCDMKCFALSLITNKCVTEYDSDDRPDHEEILTVGKGRENDVKILIETLVNRLGKNK